MATRNRDKRQPPAALVAISVNMLPALEGEAEKRMLAGKKDPSPNLEQGSQTGKSTAIAADLFGRITECVSEWAAANGVSGPVAGRYCLALQDAAANEWNRRRKAVRTTSSGGRGLAELLAGRKPGESLAVILNEHRATFRGWLSGQRRRDDAVGDLARDVLADPRFSRRIRTLEQAREYLTRCDASPAAHDALRRAWQEFTERT